MPVMLQVKLVTVHFEMFEALDSGNGLSLSSLFKRAVFGEFLFGISSRVNSQSPVLLSRRMTTL